MSKSIEATIVAPATCPACHKATDWLSIPPSLITLDDPGHGPTVQMVGWNCGSCYFGTVVSAGTETMHSQHHVYVNLPGRTFQQEPIPDGWAISVQREEAAKCSLP